MAPSSARSPVGQPSSSRDSQRRAPAVSRLTPRYLEIEQQLRSRIAALTPHDALPSDAELCEEFNVSRMTARQAVQRLVQDGLVYRQAGRGTFVAPSVVDRQIANLRGFSAEMKARGLIPTSIVVNATFGVGSTDQTTALRLPPHSRVVTIERVRLADVVPMAYERATLCARCAGVLDADLVTGSLHAALLAQGVLPNSGESTVTAELANATDIEYLQVRRRSPLLVERRLIRDGNTTPIEWTESRYVPERYSLTAQFTVELPR